MPGEQVQVRVSRRKNQWEQATMAALRRESAQRVTPACPHFGLHAGACGGCKMQHLHASAQVAIKQRVLEDALWHLAKVRPEQVLRPIEGPAFGYRNRARLSVRNVHKKGTVLVGFHERKSSYVADMQSCAVLPPQVSALLMPLRALVASMDQRDRLPQIELAVGDTVTALVLRHLEPMSEPTWRACASLRAEHGIQWWLQAKGPDAIVPLDGGGPTLAYALAEFGIVMPFRPTDFTQVNPNINGVLVGQALRLLDAAAARTGHRLVLRAREFHAADRHPRARGAGHRGQRERWLHVHARTPLATTLATPGLPPARVSSLATCSNSRPSSSLRTEPATNGSSTHRARAPSRWPRRLPN